MMVGITSPRYKGSWMVYGTERYQKVCVFVYIYIYIYKTLLVSKNLQPSLHIPEWYQNKAILVQQWYVRIFLSYGKPSTYSQSDCHQVTAMYSNRTWIANPDNGGPDWLPGLPARPPLRPFSCSKWCIRNKHGILKYVMWALIMWSLFLSPHNLL